MLAIPTIIGFTIKPIVNSTLTLGQIYRQIVVVWVLSCMREELVLTIIRNQNLCSPPDSHCHTLPKPRHDTEKWKPNHKTSVNSLTHKSTLVRHIMLTFSLVSIMRPTEIDPCVQKPTEIPGPDSNLPVSCRVSNNVWQHESSDEHRLQPPTIFAFIANVHNNTFIQLPAQTMKVERVYNILMFLVFLPSRQ